MIAVPGTGGAAGYGLSAVDARKVGAIDAISSGHWEEPLTGPGIGVLSGSLHSGVLGLDATATTTYAPS